jgi:hypothetical protein
MLLKDFKTLELALVFSKFGPAKSLDAKGAEFHAKVANGLYRLEV